MDPFTQLTHKNYQLSMDTGYSLENPPEAMEYTDE